MHMHIETWPISRLRPYAGNPRKNDAVVPRMVEALREFGFRIPLLVRGDGEVIDGHLRLKAALAMGLTEVPVIAADDMTPEQVRAFRILVNQSANWADWDNDLLLLELRALQAADFDVRLTGFDQKELDALLREMERPGDGEATEEGEDLPEAPQAPVTRTGDVWLLGDHALACVDATDAAAVAALMEKLPPCASPARLTAASVTTRRKFPIGTSLCVECSRIPCPCCLMDKFL
jgi:ParB-like chromosome segregation protein Spo0J